jgi:hypothetical protein
MYTTPLQLFSLLHWACANLHPLVLLLPRNRCHKLHLAACALGSCCGLQRLQQLPRQQLNALVCPSAIEHHSSRCCSSNQLAGSLLLLLLLMRWHVLMCCCSHSQALSQQLHCTGCQCSSCWHVACTSCPRSSP